MTAGFPHRPGSVPTAALLDAVHDLHEGELQDLRAQINALEGERARMARILIDRDSLGRHLDRYLDKAAGYVLAGDPVSAQQQIAWAQALGSQIRCVGRLHEDAPHTGNVVSLAAARAGRA